MIRCALCQLRPAAADRLLCGTCQPMLTPEQIERLCELREIADRAPVILPGSALGDLLGGLRHLDSAVVMRSTMQALDLTRAFDSVRKENSFAPLSEAL